MVEVECVLPNCADDSKYHSHELLKIPLLSLLVIEALRRRQEKIRKHGSGGVLGYDIRFYQGFHVSIW